MEQVVADRDWSSASEEEVDADDEGLKTLALYQANPPRRGGELGEHIPCRTCLLERLCCQRPNGPGTACTLCQRRVEAGQNQKCSSDLRGAGRYPSKYGGADAEPGDGRPLFLGTGLRLRQPGNSSRSTKPIYLMRLKRRTRPAESSEPSEAPEPSRRRQEIVADTPMPAPQEADSPLESDESIITRLFEGNAEDSGWKLLQAYFRHRRHRRSRVNHSSRPAQRIPRRTCLRRRLTCISPAEPGGRCGACSQHESAKCKYDLRDTLGYEWSWRDLVPPELLGPARNPRSSVAGAQGLLPTETEEQDDSHLENYFEIEEGDDDDDQDQSASNVDEQFPLDRSIEHQDLLSRMFDNDADDPGYQSLLWYLSRRRLNNETAEKIPCRRCLRANYLCHMFDGPEGSCRECARPTVRARCIADLRGAELYHFLRR